MNNLLVEQSNDLKAVREQMRAIMSYLTNEDIDIAERKSMVALYNTVNNSAKIIVSSIITDIAINKFTGIDYDKTRVVDSEL